MQENLKTQRELNCPMRMVGFQKARKRSNTKEKYWKSRLFMVSWDNEENIATVFLRFFSAKWSPKEYSPNEKSPSVALESREALCARPHRHRVDEGAGGAGVLHGWKL